MDVLRHIGEDGGEVAGPIRPYASETFIVACALWLAGACTYQGASLLAPAVLATACAVASLFGIAAAAASFYCSGRRAQYLLMVVLGLSLGVFCGSAAGLKMYQGMQRAAQEQPSDFLFEVVEDPFEGEYSTSCIAKTMNAFGDEVIVQVRLPENGASLHYGSRFSAQASLKVPPKGQGGFLWGKGAHATTSLTSYEKVERSDLLGTLAMVRERAISLFEGHGSQGAALLRAILFADRAALDDGGFYSSVKVVGLAHMVAVSGAHLVIVSSFIGLVLKALRVPRRVTVAIQVLFICMYLVFTAMPISALRAACMTIIATCSVYFKRKASTLDALALCIITIVAASPAAALSVSFMLSALSTIGIVIIGPLVRSWTEKLVPRLPASVHEGLALTLAASLMTIPLSAACFSQVSLIAPLMNIVAAPWFALLCIAGFAATLVGLCLPAAQALVVSALFCSDAFCGLVEVAAQLPYAAIPASMEMAAALLASSAALAVLWARWPRPSAGAGIAIVSASFFALALVLFVVPVFSEDEVIMLDVGQGDAFVIRSEGRVLLIDTGTHDAALLAGLARHGIYRLDGVMLSHADDDHCGSLLALDGIVQVGQVFVAKAMTSCPCASCETLLEQARNLVGDDGVVPLSAFDTIRLGAFELTALWPDELVDEGGNADSLAVLLAKPTEQALEGLPDDSPSDGRSLGFTALFCGDLERSELDDMIEKGRLSSVDMLKIGHHGSRDALSAELAQYLQPKAALISVGLQNRYGHPSPEVLDILDEIGCKVFRTDEMGDVVCKIEAGEMELRALG